MTDLSCTIHINTIVNFLYAYIHFKVIAKISQVTVSNRNASVESKGLFIFRPQKSTANIDTTTDNLELMEGSEGTVRFFWLMVISKISIWNYVNSFG